MVTAIFYQEKEQTLNTIEWLMRLVTYDTTSRYSNLQLIDDVQYWLTKHHISYRITTNAQEKKANLLATLPAHNGQREGGIIFSGHTDVVPVDGQTWDTNPFEAIIQGENIYGRGTCDMKGFLAVTLALMPEFQSLPLKQPIHFAFSYDEEIGCRGVPLLIDDLKIIDQHPRACIVGEPTLMQAVIAHKGIQVFRCRVQGHAVHSSLTPHGCNAIEYAAQLICYIRQLADHFREVGPFDHYYDVPFTTVSTNMIQGGIAQNIIPAMCDFTFEFRHLPRVKPHDIIDRIKTYIKNELQPNMQKEQAMASIEIDNLAAVPSFEMAEDEAIHQWVNHIIGQGDIKKVSYATEAGLFQQADIPTMVCGPGSIEQAHRANEFIALSQLHHCEEFLRQLVNK